MNDKSHDMTPNGMLLDVNVSLYGKRIYFLKDTTNI